LPARILVVDDDPLTGELNLRKSSARPAWRPLSNQQYRSRRASEAREISWRLSRHAHVPAPDGAELARQLRASRINASTVIAMITGEQDRTVMGRTFAARVEFFLFKPVERNKLLKLIRVTEGPIERERRRFTRVRLRYRVSMESGHDRLVQIHLAT